MAINLGRFEHVKSQGPLWKDALAILVYPLAPAEPLRAFITIGFIAVWGASKHYLGASQFFIFHWILAAIFAVYVAALCYESIQQSSHGERKLPPWASLKYFHDEAIRPASKLTILCMGIWLPIAIVAASKWFLYDLTQVERIGLYAASITGLLALPIVLAVSVREEASVFTALNPLAIVRHLFQLRQSYLSLLAFVAIGVTAIFAIAKQVNALMQFPEFTLLRLTLGMFAIYYVLLFVSCSIGRFFFEKRYALGFAVPPAEWEYSFKVPNGGWQSAEWYRRPEIDLPDMAVTPADITGKQEEGRSWIIEGRRYKKIGKYQVAIECFRRTLAHQPDDVVALRELFKVCRLIGREKEATSAANRLMRVHLDSKSRVEALTLYGEVVATIPSFSFSRDIQWQIIAWLREIDDPQGLLIACRNFAYHHQKDEDAPDALLQAASVARNQLDCPEMANKLLRIIMGQYKESEAAKKASMQYYQQSEAPKE